MSIQKLVSKLNKRAGELEIIKHMRTKGVVTKDRDLLHGIYITDSGIEVMGSTGMSVDIEINRSLKYEENTSYTKIYNNTITLLFRNLE